MTTAFDREKLIALLKRDSLRLGTFTLASGRTSHYYVDGRKVHDFNLAEPAECDAVVANFPDWVLETREAFWIFLPDKTTGACPENLMPVWRVYRPRCSRLAAASAR